MSHDPTPETSIPVTILTGFLGSGKTTLLNRILTGDHGLRVAVLVNDFGAINVDAELVVGVEDDMISLANGCVCCQVRDDLIEAIDRVLEQPAPVDYILLEASGIAEPGSIFVTFTDAKYRDKIRVDSITCVVDTEQVLNENEEEDFAILKLRQIGFADLLILDKTDLVSADHLANVRKWIDSHLSRVRIVEAEQCQVPLEVLLSVGRFDPNQQSDLAEQLPTNHGDLFATWSFTTDEPMCLDALKDMINRQLPGGIYRCKGIVHASADFGRRWILQVVGRRSDVTKDRLWGSERPRTQIVAIAAKKDFDPSRLQQLFESCIEGRERIIDKPDLPGTETVRI